MVIINNIIFSNLLFTKAPNGVVFKPPPITAMQLWKTMPIIIYLFIFSTKFKELLTFTPQLYNYTNAAQFKAVSLENGLYLRP